MAAPTPTARVTPGGIMLRDGYQSLVTNALDTDISFQEKTTKPPSSMGGDPIPQSTMWNVDWHTFYPRSLLKMGDMSIKAAYDAFAFGQFVAIQNVPTTITHRWADLTTLAYFGWFGDWEPGEQQEGSQPDVDITVHASMYDKTNDLEATYALADGSGT